MTTIERGHLGTMPLGAERDDDSYLDFVEGIRTFTQMKVSGVLQQRATEAVKEFEAKNGRGVQNMDEVRQVMDPIPVVASRNRIMRTSQEMMWQGVIDTYRKREKELLAELAMYDTLGPGTVEYDPNFKQPDYYSNVEFHIQPGNYHADPLAGYIYHYGTKVFFGGRNNNDDVQRQSVMLAPTPKDGKVNRILDMACSIGQSTTALKERFPNAEVWGIDLGAPMVRYAHKRAVDMGLEVHFAQRAAEQSGFESGSFDMVYAFIFFHEIPVEISKAVVREAHRLLRPGGVFIVMEFPSKPGANTKITNPAGEYFRDFDTNDNGEPYASDFVYWDFHGYLREIFGNDIVENVSPKTFLPMRAAWKQ